MQLSPEFADVLRSALELARDSGGAYDPTAAPLVDLWGFGPAPRVQVVPSEAAISAARAVVGWQRLPFDPVTRHVMQPGGLRLDLSAIAKGHGVDLVRSEEHTSELQSLMRISYAVFCLKKKKKTTHNTHRPLYVYITHKED